MWHIMTITHWRIWVLCVPTVVNMRKSNVDVIDNRSGSKTKIKQGLRQPWKENKIRVWLCKKFCWCKLFSTQVGCDSLQHNLNILFDPPTLKQCSHTALRATVRLKTLSAITVDHSSQKLTPRSYEDSTAKMRLILLSLLAWGKESSRREGRKLKRNPKHFTCIPLDSKLPTLQIAGKKKSTSSRQPL